ncbi:DNA-binding HxlR family transcriptional regulator [Bradyrhizobium sp. USDA 4503]
MKGRRTDLSQNACAASRALEVFGDWWSLLIVRNALLGMEKFSGFQKSIGLAKNILSRLRKLVDGGVLQLVSDEASPNRHKYLLTDKGKALAVVIMAIWQWGEENCFDPGESLPLLIDKASELPLAKLEIKTADGRVVDPRELQMSLVERPS